VRQPLCIGSFTFSALIFLLAGREFQAVFLSTSEPTLSDMKVSNPTKSISDPYVFNTAITRAQSLVVSVGNPFTLLKIEKHMVEKYLDRGDAGPITLLFAYKTTPSTSLTPLVHLKSLTAFINCEDTSNLHHNQVHSQIQTAFSKHIWRMHGD